MAALVILVMLGVVGSAVSRGGAVDSAMLAAPARAPSQNAPDVMTSSELRSGTHVTDGGDLACLTKEAVQKGRSLADDAAALREFMQDETNGCTILKSGLPVVVDNVDGFYVQIRMKGHQDDVWTYRSALRR